MDFTVVLDSVGYNRVLDRQESDRRANMMDRARLELRTLFGFHHLLLLLQHRPRCVHVVGMGRQRHADEKNIVRITFRQQTVDGGRISRYTRFRNFYDEFFGVGLVVDSGPTPYFARVIQGRLRRRQVRGGVDACLFLTHFGHNVGRQLVRIDSAAPGISW
jgi:hypothetical protein